MTQPTDIRKIVKLKSPENLITWQSDFKRLARLEEIWEHFLEDPIELYSQSPQLTTDRFRLFTSPLETRFNARTNQDQYDLVAYQESYKAYVDFQSKKQKTLGIFISSFDSIIQ